MADKTAEKTTDQIHAEKVELARKVNEQRNAARLERLNAIADGSDQAHAHEMIDTDGNKLIMKDETVDEEPTAEEKEAVALQQESEEAEKVQAEKQALALQEEGTEPKEPSAGGEAEKEGDKLPPEVRMIDGAMHVSLTINGKQSWQPLNQVLAAAQKVESADEYLQSAAESVRNAARLDLSSKKDEPNKVEEVDLEQTLSSAVMGDQEAIKKLASVLKARPSAVTPDVLQQIDERWFARRAAEEFEKEYADVLGDPLLKRLVLERDSEMAQSNPTMPMKQRLKAVGDEIRGWKQKLTGVKATSSTDKIERKKTLVNVPSAAARQTPVEDEESEESTSDSIQKMANARGQARAIVHRGTNQR